MSEPTKSNQWLAAVTGGLQAHFKQTDGASRPGVDRAVTLTAGTIEKRVMVRSYADEGRSIAAEQEIPVVLSFISSLLAKGWSPDDFQFKPGELTVPPSQQLATSAPGRGAPWWKLW